MELGSARADDARQLDRLPGAPVLVVTTRYIAHGTTAAVGVSTYRADTCRLTFGDRVSEPLAATPESTPAERAHGGRHRAGAARLSRR